MLKLVLVLSKIFFINIMFEQIKFLISNNYYD